MGPNIKEVLTHISTVLVGHRTCDSLVASSTPGWAPSRGGLGQASVYLSLNSIIRYWPSIVMLVGWEDNRRPWWKPTTAYTQAISHQRADCQDTWISSDPNAR